MLEIVDINFLQNTQDFFANSMNVALQTFDANGALTKPSNFIEFCSDYTMTSIVGHKRCEACLHEWVNNVMQQNKPVIFKCHAGLVNFGIPVLINGKTIAVALGGKLLTEAPDEEHFAALAKEIEVDEYKYVSEAKKIRIIPLDKIEVIVEALFQVINSISSIAYAKRILSKSGMDYKIQRNLAIEELLFLNCEKVDIPLSTREFEILKLIVKGKSNREIAKELFISVHTAKAHVSSILEKFSVGDRTQVAVKAVKEGII